MSTGIFDSTGALGGIDVVAPPNESDFLGTFERGGLGSGWRDGTVPLAPGTWGGVHFDFSLDRTSLCMGFFKLLDFRPLKDPLTTPPAASAGLEFD